MLSVRRVGAMQALAVIAAAGVAGAAGCSATSENAEPQPTRRAPSRSRAVVLPLSSPRPRVAEPVAGAHAGAPGRRAAAVASARTGVAGELRRAVGQKIMTRMSGLYPSQRLLWRVRRGQVGGVILFADNVRAPAQVTRAVAALQAAAARGGNPRLLIAVDQEGGDVRRLRWAPPRLSAAALGSNSATASRQGQAAGRALRKVGINLDLAPVLDVPAVPESFLGGRAFGPTAQAVGRAGCAFARGLRRGGVLTAAKHFPGLGYAHANTDLAPVAIDAAASRLRSAYRPYRECLRAGALNIVMVSNAAYPALGARVPAVMSPRIVEGELRERLGFGGVVMSDSLRSPGVQHVPDATVKATRASVDILLYPTTESASAGAFWELLRAAHSRPALRHDIAASARRIRALKEQAVV